MISDMCLKCVDTYVQGRSNFYRIQDAKLVACSCYLIVQEKLLPTDLHISHDRFFSWEIILEKGLYPNFKFAQIGVGKPGENGLTQKSECHFICENGVISSRELQESPISIRPYLESDNSIPCWLQVGYWTGTSAISFSYKNYIKISEFRNINSELYPIAVVGTEYGDINLVQSISIPSLKTFSANQVVKQVRKISDINEIIAPPAISTLLKQTWIRLHAIKLYVPTNNCIKYNRTHYRRF